MLVLIPLAKKMSSYRNVSMLANVSALANVSIKPPYDYELVSISSISYSSLVMGGNKPAGNPATSDEICNKDYLRWCVEGSALKLML